MQPIRFHLAFALALLAAPPAAFALTPSTDLDERPPRLPIGAVIQGDTTDGDDERESGHYARIPAVFDGDEIATRGAGSPDHIWCLRSLAQMREFASPGCGLYEVNAVSGSVTARASAWLSDRMDTLVVDHLFAPGPYSLRLVSIRRRAEIILSARVALSEERELVVAVRRGDRRTPFFGAPLSADLELRSGSGAARVVATGERTPAGRLRFAIPAGIEVSGAQVRVVIADTAAVQGAVSPWRNVT